MSRILVPPAVEMTPLEANMPRDWQEPILSAEFVEACYGIEGHELAGMAIAPRNSSPQPTVAQQLLVFRTTAVKTPVGIRPIITHASDRYQGDRRFVEEGDLTVVTAQGLGNLMMHTSDLGSDDLYTTRILGIPAAVVHVGAKRVFGRDTSAGGHNLDGALSHKMFSRRHFELDNTQPGMVSITDLGSKLGTLATR